ncbi:MAG TPA: hypothetical protein P5309_08885 [Syntrophomonadaceae bacterium]|nr:hypothetical protein [Syntrophomonadaceae bacterium]
MDKSDPGPKHQFRFNTPDDLLSFLTSNRDSEFSFRAVPIAGAPEMFYYHNDKVVREPDGKSFTSMDEFTCYVFQCDAEGYARTEHVDLEIIN